MKNKGFTLAELMGVIIVLAAVVLVVIPLVDKNIKQSRETAYAKQIENIENGAKDWTLKNLDSLPDEEGSKITITLAQLKQGGYLPLNIKNPITDKLFANDMLITVTRKSNNYEYFVEVETGTEETNEEYNPNAPVIILIGNYLEYAEISTSNVEYIDKGVIAKTSTGQVISSSEVSVEYLLNNSQVSKINTNAFNTYVITYTVTKDGITTKANRTVIVRDSLPPELTIPDNITITLLQVSSFNLNTGVSGVDNSGQTPQITVSGSLENKVGKYSITYTATDSSGNANSRKRIITVVE